MGSRDSCAVAPSAALIASLLALLSASAAEAQPASVEELVSAVVRINTHITPDGRTVQGLGREREGSGILIDADGLILTIGYLMVEAYAAEVVDNSGRTVPANVVATTTRPVSACCAPSSRSSSSRCRWASPPRSGKAIPC